MSGMGWVRYDQSPEICRGHIISSSHEHEGDMEDHGEEGGRVCVEM